MRFTRPEDCKKYIDLVYGPDNEGTIDGKRFMRRPDGSIAVTESSGADADISIFSKSGDGGMRYFSRNAVIESDETYNASGQVERDKTTNLERNGSYYSTMREHNHPGNVLSAEEKEDNRGAPNYSFTRKEWDANFVITREKIDKIEFLARRDEVSNKQTHSERIRQPDGTYRTVSSENNSLRIGPGNGYSSASTTTTITAADNKFLRSDGTWTSTVTNDGIETRVFDPVTNTQKWTSRSNDRDGSVFVVEETRDSSGNATLSGFRERTNSDGTKFRSEFKDGDWVVVDTANRAVNFSRPGILAAFADNKADIGGAQDPEIAAAPKLSVALPKLG